MADNISELSNGLPGEIQKVDGGKWRFLKKIVSTSKEGFRRIIYTRRGEMGYTAKTTEVPEVQIPQDSGLDQLIKRMESTGSSISANRIKHLYPDCIKYLDGNLGDRYKDDPSIPVKIKDELNSGNKEIIEMFARVLAEKYTQDIKGKRLGRVRDEKRGLGNHEEQMGYKKREAELVVYEMSKMIESEEKRQSRADFACQHNEWKMLLNKPRIQEDIDMDRELAHIVLDPTVPAQNSSQN